MYVCLHIYFTILSASPSLPWALNVVYCDTTTIKEPERDAVAIEALASVDVSQSEAWRKAEIIPLKTALRCEQGASYF